MTFEPPETEKLIKGHSGIILHVEGGAGERGCYNRERQ